MIIYKDCLTGDEIISDTYHLKDVGDGLWEVDLKNMTVGGENFVLEGANASAEGEDAEDVDNATEQKLDIVVSFRLNDYPKMDKKAFQGFFKTYAKAVVAKLKELDKDEQASEFQKNATAGFKRIAGNLNNYDLYIGESMGEPAMIVFVDFREDGITPYATIFKDALIEMKV